MAERGRARDLPVDEDVTPWQRVETQGAERQRHLNRHEGIRPDVDRLRGSVLQRLVDELELVRAGGEHQSAGIVGADKPAVFEDLDLNGEVERNPTRRIRWRDLDRWSWTLRAPRLGRSRRCRAGG